MADLMVAPTAAQWVDQRADWKVGELAALEYWLDSPMEMQGTQSVY